MDDRYNSAEALEIAVLDAYFSNRFARDESACALVEEKKTTVEIQDELSRTMKIDDYVIVDYMLKNNYLLVPDEDGSPIWRMFRIV